MHQIGGSRNAYSNAQQSQLTGILMTYGQLLLLLGMLNLERSQHT